jgi:sugar phosphate isomerase/epimerase
MNPLAFSTLGCPGWDLEQILSGARVSGYGAVELRGYLDAIDVTLAGPFLPERRAETRSRFADSGIAICCIGSSATVGKGDAELPHLRACAELARDLACPYVRIFGGKRTPESPETLRAFGDIAAQHGIALVLETHDDFSTGASVASLLAEAAHPDVFALWDLHHPLRLGESPDETFAAIGAATRHVHVKDGLPGGYTLLGDGDVPVKAMLDLLLASGYTGAISLEWEKRWHPELPGPEVAFPQYAAGLRALLEGRAS